MPNSAERARITRELDRIKGETRTDVGKILDDMETTAGDEFDKGLGRAEKAYSRVFDEEKGGVGTWLTTWGDDWEELIEHSLATAKAAYDDEVSRTIDVVADYVEGKLAEAKRRVARGKADVDQFVAGLDKSVAEFGREASARIAGDFEQMTGEIDARRDKLVNNLVQKFSESQQRVSAMEQKLREENKSLWQRIYDATVGVIKTILAFKDMLLNVLARAAGVIGAILDDPIGFLGNLISGVMAGLNQFCRQYRRASEEGPDGLAVRRAGRRRHPVARHLRPQGHPQHRAAGARADLRQHPRARRAHAWRGDREPARAGGRGLQDPGDRRARRVCGRCWWRSSAASRTCCSSRSATG